MTMMDHQLAGVAEMVVRCFTEADGDTTARPSLLADAVGLGKTAQIIGVIQTLWHLKAIQDSNPHWPDEPDDVKAKWPPYLHGRKSYMGLGRIPPLPILLVLPPTLMGQWRGEFAAWLADDACHILQYRSADLDYRGFSGENGPFKRAMKLAGEHQERTVLLVEGSGLCLEGRYLLTDQGQAASAEPSQGHEPDVAQSIFGQEFLLGVVDEGHQYRNVGQNFFTLLTILERCRQRIISTATPVTTHPRNQLNLLRLLRVKAFTGPPGIAMSAKVEKLFKEGNKEWEDELEQELLDNFIHSLRSNDVLENPEADVDSSQLLARKLSDSQMLDKSKYKKFWVTRKGLFLLRHLSRGIIIRRDSRSKDSKGESLLGLLPKLDITSFLKLYGPTLVAVDKEAERLGSIRSDSKLIEGFFTRLKQILVHHRLDTADKKTDVKGFFKDKSSYEADLSAKIDRVLRICRHHLGTENTHAPPLYWNVDGEEIPGPPLDEAAQPDNAKKRKIVIYCHLSNSWNLLDQVLKLYDIRTTKINGKMSLNKRNAAIKDFNSEDGPDVMLLSDVGATGLNLQRGSIMIFVDHPWSDADVQQIVGRVLRRGQLQQVIVYRLVAPGTPDEYLIGYAESKKLMLELLIDILQITGLSEEEILLRLTNEEDDEEPTTYKRKSRAQGRVARNLIDDEAEEAGSSDTPDDDDNANSGRRTQVSQQQIRSIAPPVSAPEHSVHDSDVLPSDIEPNVPKRGGKPHPDFPELGPRPKARTAHLRWWNERIKIKEHRRELETFRESRRKEVRARRQADEAARARPTEEQQRLLDNLDAHQREGSEEPVRDKSSKEQHLKKPETEYVRQNPSTGTPAKRKPRPRPVPPPTSTASGASGKRAPIDFFSLARPSSSALPESEPEPISSAPPTTSRKSGKRSLAEILSLARSTSSVLPESEPEPTSSASAKTQEPQSDKGKGKGKGIESDEESDEQTTEVPETEYEQSEPMEDVEQDLPELTPIQTTFIGLLNSDDPRVRLSLDQAQEQLTAIGQAFPQYILEQLRGRESSAGPIAGPSRPAPPPAPPAPSPPSPPSRPSRPSPPAPPAGLSRGTSSQITRSTSGEDMQPSGVDDEGASSQGGGLSPEWDHDSDDVPNEQLPREMLDLTLDMDDIPPPNQQAGQKRARLISSSPGDPASSSRQHTGESSQPASSSFPNPPTQVQDRATRLRKLVWRLKNDRSDT
ncbi:SNF2 family amino-terminal protein, partial [Rhizoctonia solani AG-3 Rhs1AP]